VSIKTLKTRGLIESSSIIFRTGQSIQKILRITHWACLDEHSLPTAILAVSMSGGDSGDGGGAGAAGDAGGAGSAGAAADGADAAGAAGAGAAGAAAGAGAGAGGAKNLVAVRLVAIHI